MSSTDAFKLAFYGIDAEYEASELLKKMDKEGAEPSATLDKEGSLLKVEVDGEQMKVLAKFLAKARKSAYMRNTCILKAERTLHSLW